MVSPGKQPSTTQEKRICSTSGWTQVFSNADHSMDLPTFPIVLVCNGIHHIVPSKYINVSKLTDWRLGLILEHMKVVRNLWQEAQVEMMLEPVVDHDFIKVETGVLSQLEVTARKLLEFRAKKATGVSQIAAAAHLTENKEDSSSSFTYKGALKGFPVPHPEGCLPSNKENTSSTVTHAATSTNTTAATTSTNIISAPPLPSLPSGSGVGAGTSSNPLTIASSDSEFGSPSPAVIQTPLAEAAPILTLLLHLLLQVSLLLLSLLFQPVVLYKAVKL